MYIHEIPSNNSYRDIQLTLVNEGLFVPECGFCQLHFESESEVLIAQKDKLIIFRFATDEGRNISHFLQNNRIHLAEITHIQDNIIQLDIVFFSGKTIPNLETMKIGYDTIFTKQVQQNLRLPSKYLEQQLPSNFLITSQYEHSSTETWLVIFKGHNPDPDFSFTNTQKFSLVGTEILLSVEQKKQDQKTFLFANNTHRYHRKYDNLLLIQANLCFEQESIVQECSDRIQMWQKEEPEKANRYLEIWDKYGELEGDIFLEKIYNIGKIPILEAHTYDNATKARIRIPKESVTYLQIGDSLQVFDANFAIDITASLENRVDWGAFMKRLKERNNKAEGQYFSSFTITNIKSDGYKKILEVKSRDKIKLSNASFLQYSIRGDLVQIKRRERARQHVLDGSGAMPQLHLIISPGGEKLYQLKNRTSKKKSPLSSFVKQKIYGTHDPRPKQIEAIDIALNTPDIAIIQGPPGTGKTTVIAAIIERLNELQNKQSGIAGKVLVSAYQQDAVDNLVSRLTINSLPTWKIGGKQEQDPIQQYDKIRHWCENIIENVRKQNPTIQESEEENLLINLWNSYLKFPSTVFAIRFLEQVLKIQKSFSLSSDLHSRIHLKITDLKQKNDLNYSIMKDLRQKIYSIRTTTQGILDDGEDKAKELLVFVEKNKNIKTFFKEIWAKVLHEFSKNVSTTKEQRKILRKTKQEMLQYYQQPPKYSQELPDATLLKLKDEIFTSLRATNQNTQNNILVDYLQELETNVFSISKTLLQYNYVYATSVQQSVRNEIIQIKQELTDRTTYETVIIDEAARTSPRDLLIPMVLASDRIILVGDHRQLPHIVEQDILNKMEQDMADTKDNAEKSQALSRSLFEHLFERCAALEKKDGRKRRITLDAQFRMHPTLGQFVSDRFYPKEEAFESPLPPKFFQHNIPTLEDKCSVWVNIPYVQHSREQKDGTSRIRAVEVEWIAKQLTSLLNNPACKQLSFGIISFYKAQTTLLKQELLKPIYGLSEHNGDSLRSDVRWLPDGSERLRIGTVDAFQGMEFDVVFLSIVRSSDTRRLTEFTNPRSIFGHLNSPERLCVSMSRQKKLLIAVGDGTLMHSDFGKQHCSHLSHFYQLCQNQSDGVVFSAQDGLLV